MAVETETQLEAWLAENVPSEPNLQTKTGIQITQNGQFSFAPDAGYDGLASVSGEVNVQGNPNYVETIEGTLANPFGSYTIKQLREEFLANNISVVLSFRFTPDSTERVFNCMLLPSAGSFLSDMNASVLEIFDKVSIVITGPVLSYNYNTSAFTRADYIRASSTDPATSIAIPSNTPCTLTIIHHPLPSGT